MNQIFKVLLKEWKKAGVARREKLAKKYGFASGEAFERMLEGEMLEPTFTVVVNRTEAALLVKEQPLQELEVTFIKADGEKRTLRGSHRGVHDHMGHLLFHEDGQLRWVDLRTLVEVVGGNTRYIVNS